MKDSSKRKYGCFTWQQIAKFVTVCSLSPVCRVYTVTLLDHKAVNVWLYNKKKMIPLFCYDVPVLAVLHKLNRRAFIANWVQLDILLVSRYLESP